MAASLTSGIGLFLGILPFLLVQLWYNWARFGSPWIVRYPFASDPSFELGNWLEGVFGLLVGSRSGLIWYAFPMVVVLGLAMRPMWQRARFLLVCTLSLTLSQVAFLSLLGFWHGGVSTGPRYLLFSAALMAVSYGCIVAGGVKSVFFRLFEIHRRMANAKGRRKGFLPAAIASVSTQGSSIRSLVR